MFETALSTIALEQDVLGSLLDDDSVTAIGDAILALDGSVGRYVEVVVDMAPVCGDEVRE